MTFTPTSIKNFFPQDLFSRIRGQVLAKNLGPGDEYLYHTVCGRWITDIDFDEKTEKEILDIARETFNDNTILRAGFHIARYQKRDGIKPQLWKHYDQSACQFSMDLCIKKTVDWQIAVDGIYYDEEPNSCVIFSGNENMHWRPEYPTDDEDKYILLLFMQFVKPDHWFFTEGSHEGFNNHGHEPDFKFRVETGYWAQPDFSNNRPVCECCDYRKILNFEERYQNEKEYWDSLYAK